MIRSVTRFEVNPVTLATGWRTSKVVGSNIVNEANETVAKIDGLIVTPSDKVPCTILSVGSYTGMDKKYVVAPSNSLKVKDNHMMLRGATKVTLQSLPALTNTY